MGDLVEQALAPAKTEEQERILGEEVVVLVTVIVL